MALNKDTELCISISSHSSNVGTILHNHAYGELGLNYLYKAFQITDLEGALNAIKSLRIRGCSVSMPFKQQILNLLDKVDEIATHIGAVNTVVNNEGKLTGYNTDYNGAMFAIKAVKAKISDSVFVLGAGGISRAIIFALVKQGFNKISVCTRSIERAQSLLRDFDVKLIDWADRGEARADLLINATPLGMKHFPVVAPFSKSNLLSCSRIIDVVNNPITTNLAEVARKQEITFVPGYEIAVEQMLYQFEYYTGFRPNRQSIVKKLLSISS